MNRERAKRVEGFTLIEVIVVLVVAAVIGTIFVTFLGASFLTSHVPRENLIRASDLNQVMENIRADYRPYPVWKPKHDYDLGDKVMPTAFWLSIYTKRPWCQCTDAGESNGAEPDWTKETGEITDGTDVKWTYQEALMTLDQLEDFIGAPDLVNKKCSGITGEKCYDKSSHQYGYYVTERKYIDFDPTTRIETDSSGQDILKVTIEARNDSGETVATATALFFK